MAVKSLKRTLLIKAVPYRGGYTLKTENGEYPQDKYVHPSRASAYRDAALLWRADSVWRGRKVRGGYRINI